MGYLSCTAQPRPQGQRLVGRTVPGVLKGSMVTALPDVGAAMEQPLSYRARYGRAPEGGGAAEAGDGGGAALDVVADRWGWGERGERLL